MFIDIALVIIIGVLVYIAIILSLMSYALRKLLITESGTNMYVYRITVEMTKMDNILRALHAIERDVCKMENRHGTNETQT
jgi:hypothetical protein